MRNEEVVKAFARREIAKNSTGSLWSNGNCLYSYSTCIAEYNVNGRLYINLTKYSVTTSRHQYLVKQYLTADIVVDSINRNKVHIVPRNERIYL